MKLVYNIFTKMSIFKKIFFINRKQKISELKIVFIGEHGSGNMKDNRNLPDIYIVINK